eukprot:g5050.t1
MLMTISMAVAFFAFLMVGVARADERTMGQGEEKVFIVCDSPRPVEFVAGGAVQFSVIVDGEVIGEEETGGADMCMTLDGADAGCGLIGIAEKKPLPRGMVRMVFETTNIPPGKHEFSIRLIQAVGGKKEEQEERHTHTCNSSFVSIDFPGWDRYVSDHFVAEKTLTRLEFIGPGGMSSKEEMQVSSSPALPSFEKLPSLLGPRFGGGNPARGKTLVATFAGKSAEKHISNVIRRFLSLGNFSVILFAYDDTQWQDHEWSDDVIIVRSSRSMKWWFVKHFLVPSVVQNYDFLLIMDEDVDITEMDVVEFLQDMRRYGVHIGQPANGEGSYGSHEVVRLREEKQSKVGTFTNFVECGPLSVFSGAVWSCVHSLLQADITCGYGYDLVWSRCAPRSTAVLHRHTMKHLNLKPGSGSNLNFGMRCAAEGLVLFRRLAKRGIVPVEPAELRDFREDDQRAVHRLRMEDWYLDEARLDKSRKAAREAAIMKAHVVE